MKLGQAQRDALDANGYCLIEGLLDAGQCAAFAQSWDDDDAFRSTVVMRRHNFGEGEYRYFAYPLPGPLQHLRESLYGEVAGIANDWVERMRQAHRYPPQLDAFLAECHAAGQSRPTPLLLKYEARGYNCLHQDLYGATLFPLQATVLLSEPGQDFGGGEFILTEQRPRMQSRARVVPLGRGDAVVFAVNERPVRGTRGHYRVRSRHGVSEITRGRRFALGIIFHDAT